MDLANELGFWYFNNKRIDVVPGQRFRWNWPDGEHFIYLRLVNDLVGILQFSKVDGIGQIQLENVYCSLEPGDIEHQIESFLKGRGYGPNQRT